MTSALVPAPVLPAVVAMSDEARQFGVEIDEADIEELRESGDLKFSYWQSDGANVEVHLLYDGDGDDDGSGYRVTTTLR